LAYISQSLAEANLLRKDEKNRRKFS